MNMSFRNGRFRPFLLLFLIVQLLSVAVYAAECSKTKLCATGCCSSAGYCGTTTDHCGKGCQSTCDFKLECDKNNPCKGNACCSKHGHCGLGPDFCSKDNCVAGCEAKGECDPGGFGAGFANHTKCPLNVCCSKHGYCGTTKDFCGKKTVNRPSCSSKSSPMRRVVGYIEGWASTRPCDRFKPSDIPDGVYTHINFAFASIDPKTFQIVPASSNDPALYRELTLKKRIDPHLKVFIAIGGWSFNDPGPTVTTFSDIARSEANQRTFIKSLISFMATYGFDGVDIDWEYPAADDREGREEDYDNLPKFLSNIKSALKQSGERNGLSIAIPASYWYLQHFDLAKISKHVDYFNVMTYDFHGSWDTPKSWLGNHLNSHTNLTEIKDAFDLLWRNKIDPDQVNMGLAFYARTFSVSNPSCMSPGCLFVAGGPKEPCTDAVGVMSNPEIMRKSGGKIGQGELDKTAAVKILKFGRTWLTYDDVDTWKLKLDFARSQCLGGAMVWAISQDTSEGKFSKQLQQATGYKSRAVTTFNNTVALGGGVFKETTENEANGDVGNSQCRWSNCGQTCPSGWSAVKREDPYRKSNKELFLDDTGCGGNGIRTFCCPPGKQPFCQWLFHNNGKCKPGCPDRTGDDEMWEVASTSAACNNGKAQVACCRGDTPGLDVYRQYKWYGKEHDCATDLGSKQCGWSSTFNMPLTSSWDGSGAQVCRDSKGKRGTRPICGDESDSTKAHFTNCGWADNFDLGLTDIADRSQCNGNCPSGKVKVALQVNKGMCSKGTLAYCCDVEATFSTKDIDEDDLEDLIKAWVKKPTCPKVDVDELSSRSTHTTPSSVTVSEQLASLVRRASSVTVPSAAAVQLTMERIMEHAPNSPETKEYRQMFDRAFGTRWKYVTAAYLADLWFPHKDTMSMALPAVNTMCHMNEEEKGAKDAGEGLGSDQTLICLWKDLEAIDPGLLQDPEDVESDVTGPTMEDLEEALGEWNWPLRWGGFGIKPRGTGGPRPVTAICPDNTKVRFQTEEYINGDNGDALADANQDFSRFFMKDTGDCLDDTVDDDGDRGDDEWVSEHILELQAFRNFIEYSMNVQNSIKDRTTPSGITIKPLFNPAEDHQLANCSMWQGDFLKGFKKWTEAGNTETPKKQLYSLLGSKGHSSHMVNCGAKLNSMKARFWKFSDPMSVTKWRTYCSEAKPSHLERAFSEFRLIAGVWNYLNHDTIQDKLVATHKDIAEWLVEFEKLYRKQYQTKPMNLGDIQWRDFMAFCFQAMVRFSKDWTDMRIRDLRKVWTDRLMELNRQYQQARAASGTRLAAQIQTERYGVLINLDKIDQWEAKFESQTKFDDEIFLLE